MAFWIEVLFFMCIAVGLGAHVCILTPLLPHTSSCTSFPCVCSVHTQVVKVIIPQPRPGKDHSEYGFVHFESHSAAVGVWEASETTELSLKGNKLTVRVVFEGGMCMGMIKLMFGCNCMAAL